MSEHIFNIPEMYPSEGFEIDLDHEDTKVERGEEKTPLSNEQRLFLKPFFKGTDILPALTADDTEFIVDVVGLTIERVFGDKKYIYDDVLDQGRRANRSIGREFISGVAETIIMEGGIKQILAEKKTMSRTDLVGRIELFKAIVAQTVHTDHELSGAVYTLYNKYSREAAGAQNETSVESFDGKLPDVMHALRDQGLITEAQFYSLGVHMGTVAFKGDAPTGNSEQDVRRRRLRSLVTSTNLELAIDRITNRYEAKNAAMRTLRSETSPLGLYPERVLLLSIGSKKAATPPVPRDQLRRILVSRNLLSGSIEPPTEKDIDQYLAEALVWVFTPPRKKTY